MNLTIEITIPILNEESTLEIQVDKIILFFNNYLKEKYEIRIVLADNGSTDSTPYIAKIIEEKYSCIRYIRIEKKGVGRALKSSWSTSQADIIGYMDLDLATDLRYLQPALEKLCDNQADIVTGSRLIRGAKVFGRSPLRTFTSRCFNIIVKKAFKISFSDGMCGFKFLKRSCLENILTAGLRSDGWFFATEILVVGEYLGYRIYDLPVEWTDDPSSKVKIGKLSVEYLKEISSLRRHLARKESI